MDRSLLQAGLLHPSFFCSVAHLVLLLPLRLWVAQRLPGSSAHTQRKHKHRKTSDAANDRPSMQALRVHWKLGHNQ